MRRLVRLSFVASLVLSLAPLASCGGSELPSTCAGHEELCDRRYDQVSFAASHNSMADSDHGRFGVTQTHDIAQQLEDGIRGFMIDTHPDPIDATRALMCHAACIDNELTLAQGLEIIVDHLKRHRDSIVTIIFESYVTDDVAAHEFEMGGAMPYVYAHVHGTPWPTLREMIASNQRLVVFTDNDGGDQTGPYPWYMDQWEYAFQNPYAAQTAADFSCTVDRGVAGPNQVFIMNHFLTNPVASIDSAMMVNPYAVLEPHVSQCQTDRAQIPNFVTVDFYEVGDVVRVVDELNGFPTPP